MRHDLVSSPTAVIDEREMILCHLHDKQIDFTSRAVLVRHFLLLLGLVSCCLYFHSVCISRTTAVEAMRHLSGVQRALLLLKKLLFLFHLFHTQAHELLQYFLRAVALAAHVGDHTKEHLDLEQGLSYHGQRRQIAIHRAL